MERRSHLQRWLVYLLVVAAAAGLLLASEEIPLRLPSDSFLASLMESGRAKKSEHKSPNALSDAIEALGSSREWLSRLRNDDAWRSGVAQYLEAAVEQHQAEWAAPSAGQPVTQEVRALQDAVQMEASTRKFQKVDIEVSNSTQQKAADYILNINTQGRTFKIELPTKQASIEPLIPGTGRLSLHLIQLRKQFIFTREEPVSNVTTLPLTDLPVGATKAVTLTPLKDHHIDGTLWFRLTGGSSDVNRLGRGNSTTPEVLKINTDGVVAHEGEVSLDKLHASDHLFLRRSGRYTAIVVLGNADLRGRVLCVRDDDGRRIGAYASEIPLMAAAANAWASLRLTVQVQNPSDVLQYRVLAMSGRNLPSRELVLATVGRLSSMEVGGRPISGPTMSRAVKWLAQTLQARFVPEDVQATDPAEVRALITHLVERAKSEPPRGEVPRIERLP